MPQFQTLILIALMVVAFYFLIMRPQRKRQQQVQQTLSALSTGARVMLGSGIFGTVVGVGQKQVVIEIADGVELTVLKQAVAKVVSDADEDSEYEVIEEIDEIEEVEPDLPSEPTSEPPMEPGSSAASDPKPTTN